MTAHNTELEDAGYWRTVGSLTKAKLAQLGAPGVVLGVIWLVGLWVWYDWAAGAYREQVPQAGRILLGILIAWLLAGLAIYLWRDPHGARSALVRRLES
ncbi:hypothetical protein [Salinilacihabitans rarus]|uniref:hypothetical protein n=1 Tax=Salinilacihabitans rarus TaxID=2961596 RepID=UPI0020C89B19|nr:hypothetical protein [Salinilacihabitans rarus]